MAYPLEPTPAYLGPRGSDAPTNERIFFSPAQRRCETAFAAPPPFTARIHRLGVRCRCNCDAVSIVEVLLKTARAEFSGSRRCKGRAHRSPLPRHSARFDSGTWCA